MCNHWLPGVTAVDIYLKTSIFRSTGAWFSCLHIDVYRSLYAPGYLRQLHKTQKHNVRPAGDQIMHSTWERLKWQKHVNKKLNQILNLKLNSTLKVKNWHVYGYIYIVKHLGFEFASSAWSPNCLHHIHISLQPGILCSALVVWVVK